MSKNRHNYVTPYFTDTRKFHQQEFHDFTEIFLHPVLLMALIIYHFLFHQKQDKEGKDRGSRNLITAQGIAVSLFISLYSLNFKPHRLALTDPPPPSC